MFILLGMLAVAASDLLLLLERRDPGVFHEVHAHDGGSCLGWTLTLHTTTDTTLLLRIYLKFFRLDDTLEYLYRHSCSMVRCSSISRQAEPSVAYKRDLECQNR